MKVLTRAVALVLALLTVGALKLSASILGLVAVPLMGATKNRPSWLWRPWYNPEDGLSVPGQFFSGLPAWARFYLYHAIRNPANGLRSYEWLDLDIDPDKVEWAGSDVADINIGNARERGTICFLCWQGWQTGFVLVMPYPKLVAGFINVVITILTFSLVEARGPRHLRVRLGWKIVPQDRNGVPPWRAEDAGFAGSVLPFRSG